MSLNKTTVTKRYAQALLDLLSEKDQLESGMAELQELRRVFLDNPQLSTVLSGAGLQPQDRDGLVAQLTKTATPYIKNLIDMVYEYGRMDLMVAIIDEFKALYDEQQHIVYAQVTSAIALSADQQDRLAAAYAQRVGAKQVIVDNQVDPALIGGAVVKSTGMVLDGSLKTKLEKLRQQLLA